MKRLFGIGLVLVSMTTCVLGQAPATASPPPSVPSRIAVISTTDTADLAALVVTELSNNPDISLVERDDLAKIGDELKIQTMADSDAVALGKLVGADGLLFLDKDGENLKVRFTAVGLGFVLFDLQIPPGPSPDALAKSLSDRVALFVPKLKLSPDKAIPLSLLNLRSDLASGTSDETERQLTLLLESRLAAVPEYVVLERRHADALGFEHSLMSSTPPELLKGAYLIDGSFRPTGIDADGEMVMSLRVRSPKTGQEISVDVKGSEKHLPGLVNEIASKISQEISPASSAAHWQPQDEAREYLREGIWAWERYLDTTALEALDSAELLGEKASDLQAIRIHVLCELENPAISFPGPNRKPLPRPLLEERVRLIRRAMQDILAYRDHGEAKLQLFGSPNQNPNVRLGDLEFMFFHQTDNLLTDLEASPLSQLTDSFRQDMRTFTGFDPLHGKVPNVNPAMPDVNPDDLANSVEEEMAFYRRRLTKDHVFLFVFPASFCPRFFKNPTDRQAAYDKFMQELQADPGGRLPWLAISCHNGDAATRDALYPQFLQELWNQREELFKTVAFQQYIQAGVRINADVRKKYIKQSLPLFHYWLSRPDRAAVQDIDDLWNLEWYSPEDIDGIWADLQTQKAFLAQGTNVDGRWTLAEFEKRFLTVFPSKQPPDPDAGLPRLTIDRYWNGMNPSHPDSMQVSLFLNQFNRSPDGDGVWALVQSVGPKGSGLYQIHLPDMTFKFFDTDYGACPIHAAETSKALYITYITFGDRSIPASTDEVYLKRYDLGSHTWATRRVTDYTYTQGGIFQFNDQLYMSWHVFKNWGQGEGGLGRYDWDEDKFTILANSRRKPGQNQFDDRGEYTMGPFIGPGNKLCVYVQCEGQNSINYVREQPGPWPGVYDFADDVKTVDLGRQTLAVSPGGEVVLLDSDKTAPIPLMAPAVPTDGRYLPGASKPTKSLPSWASQAIWKAQPEWAMMSWTNYPCYHDGHLYLLASPKEQRTYFELLAFNPGQAEPVHIPLRFLVKGSEEEAVKILGPSPGTWGPYLCAVDQGICLHDDKGFWFLPYSDIDAYLKSNPNLVHTL